MLIRKDPDRRRTPIAACCADARFRGIPTGELSPRTIRRNPIHPSEEKRPPPQPSSRGNVAPTIELTSQSGLADARMAVRERDNLRDKIDKREQIMHAAERLFASRR